MSANEMISYLKIALFTPGLNDRWGLPILFWGEPGIGKSKVIESVSEKYSLDCHTLVASIREPSDFGGLPIPAKKGNQTYIEYTPPAWASTFKSGRGVVFLDEITTCAPAVQAALLRLVLNGALGDYQLPPGVRFLSAANEVVDAAGGWDLSTPLANRFGHIPWSIPSAGEWTDWLIGMSDQATNITVDPNAKEIKVDHNVVERKTFDPSEEEMRVLKHWPEAFATAKGAIASFIKARSDLLHQMPKVGQSGRSKAWPSPRSWELTTRALAGAHVHNASDDVETNLIDAFIGSGAGAEFLSFRTKLDLPDPAQVLDKKVKFTHTPTRLDRTVAVLASCTALLSHEKCKKRNERSVYFWELLRNISEDASDLTIQPASMLIKNNLGMSSKATRPLLVALRPVLKSAGIKVR